MVFIFDGTSSSTIFVTDAAFLGAFAYAGYRSVGRWLKFTDETAKRLDDSSYLELFQDALAEEVQNGNRSSVAPGEGSTSSGQGHVFADWKRFNTKQRIMLLQELERILRWSGQEQEWRHLRRSAGRPWRELNHAAKSQLMLAADALDWSFIQDLVEEGEQIAQRQRIWQVTEPLPQLAAEPAMMAAPAAEAEALKELVSEREPALLAVLEAAERSRISALQPAEKLHVNEAARKAQMLRELLQGPLGLSVSGRAVRGPQLLELLRSLDLAPASEEDKDAKAAAIEALDSAVSEQLKEQQEAGEKQLVTLKERARARELASGLQHAVTASGDLAVADAVSLFGLGLDEIEASLGANGSGREGVQQRLALVALLYGAVSRSGISPEQQEALSEVLDLLQPELGRPAKPAAEGGDDADEESGVAPLLARAREELSKVEVPQQEQQGQQAEEGEEGEAAAAKPDAAEVLRKGVDEAVAAEVERMQASQQAQLQAERQKQRIALVMQKVRAHLDHADTAKQQQEKQQEEQQEESKEEEADTEDTKAALSAAEALAYGELYLRQLGSRPLAAAVPEVEKVLGSGVVTDVKLDDAADEAVTQARTLLRELSMIEKVQKLELGPNATATLTDIAQLMSTKVQEQQQQQAQQGDEEGEEAASPAPKSKAEEAAGRAKELAEELLNDGLVLLELTPLQYRKLSALREAAAQLRPGMDGLARERSVNSVKDVAGQLGPIGAAIDARIGDTSDEGRAELLKEQKALALDLYGRLQAFISFEENARRPAQKAIAQLKVLSGGVAVGKSGSALASLQSKADEADAQVAVLQEMVDSVAADLADSAQQPADDNTDTDAAAAGGDAAVGPAREALQALSDRVASLRQEASSYAAYARLRERALASGAGAVDTEGLELSTLEHIQPELGIPLANLPDTDPEQIADWEAQGYQAIARGRVATVLIATAPLVGDPPGQPRCVAEVGLASGKCVLQLWAERLLRLQRQAALHAFGPNSPPTRAIQWYIMASPATRAGIDEALSARRYYGLSPSQVHVFTCDVAPPLLTEELKVAMASPFKFAAAKPGSGEVVPALQSSGMLRHMRSAGVRHVEIHTVEDNLLARPADPLFIGYSAASGAGAAAKVTEPAHVAPAYAAALGTGDATSDEVAEDIGFLAPTTGVYCFSTDALQALGSYYAASPLAGYRLVPAPGVPTRGNAIAAPTPAPGPNAGPAAAVAAAAAARQAAIAAAATGNGYAFTRLLSDVFASPALEGAHKALLGVDAMEEFAPVWGSAAYPVAGPEDAVGDLMALHTRWVEDAGGHVECPEGVEVSPLVSYAGEGLEELCVDHTFTEPYDLALQGAAAGGGSGGGIAARTNVGSWFVPLAVGYVAVAAVAAAKAVGQAVARK